MLLDADTRESGDWFFRTSFLRVSRGRERDRLGEVSPGEVKGEMDGCFGVL